MGIGLITGIAVFLTLRTVNNRSRDTRQRVVFKLFVEF